MLKQKIAEEEEKLIEEKKKMVDKKQSYAKYVKEMYWPKVSTRKQLELEQFKEKLKSNFILTIYQDQYKQEGNQEVFLSQTQKTIDFKPSKKWCGRED